MDLILRRRIDKQQKVHQCGNLWEIGCKRCTLFWEIGKTRQSTLESIMSDSFTIQISSNLVKQLADDGEKLKKRTRKPKAPREHSRAKEHQKHIDYPDTLKSANVVGWPVQPPLFMPTTPPQPPAYKEIDAIRSLLQDGEKVLERLQKHEEDMVRKVTQRAKDLHEKEFKIPHQKPMPCMVEKDACMDCYKENVKDPLKCADLVKQFADCARTARQQVSSSDK